MAQAQYRVQPQYANRQALIEYALEDVETIAQLRARVEALEATLRAVQPVIEDTFDERAPDRDTVGAVHSRIKALLKEEQHP
jgi:hypothetical protein